MATLFQTWSDGSKYGPEVLDLVPIMHGTAAEALAIFRRLFERSGALSWTEDLRQKLHLPDTTSFLRVIWFGTDHGSDMVASVNAVKREAHDGGGGCVPASAEGGTGVAAEDGDTPVEVPAVAVPASAEGGAEMVAMEDSDTPEGAPAALVGGAPAAPVEAAPAAPVEATPAAQAEPPKAVTAGPSGNSAAARGADIAGGRRRRKRPRTGSNDGGEGCVPSSAQGGTGVATEDGDTPVEGAPAPRPATCARTDPRCPLPHRGPAARAHVRGASA